MPSYKFTAIPDFFLQDSPTAIPSEIGPIPSRLGLLPRFESWSAFRAEIEERKRQAREQDGSDVKVIWMCRHGQGFHNVGEAKYGTEAWDAHWARLNGDGELTWGPDPLLTTLGKSQAAALCDAWQAELGSQSQDIIPFPERSYVSPLTRAIETHDIVFGDEIKKRDGRTLIIESLREENGIRTCDRRRPLSYLKDTIPSLYPHSGFICEEGMSEEDILWNPDVRETHEEVNVRAKGVLESIFREPEDVTYVSITAHGGIINGLLNSVGRGRYALPTGGILPIVVKRSLVDA